MAQMWAHPYHNMNPSTSKGKEASTTCTSVSFKQESNDAAEVTVIKRKMQIRRKHRHTASELRLFSDPLDSTSDDEQSFDEEDMFGSDPDAETISLGFKSNKKKQSFDEDIVGIIISGYLVQECLHLIQDGDLIPQFEGMSMDLRNISAMMDALCEAEGIDVSSITGDMKDHSLSPSTPYSTLETSSQSDIVSKNIKN